MVERLDQMLGDLNAVRLRSQAIEAAMPEMSDDEHLAAARRLMRVRVQLEACTTSVRACVLPRPGKRLAGPGAETDALYQGHPAE